MNQLGYYGKTPHRGDFVRFNLPQSFVSVWDDWLQSILIAGEQRGDAWRDLYLGAPQMRFVLSSGVAGNEVWMGVLRPSQDKVGRRFPFCLAFSLPDTTPPYLSLLLQQELFLALEELLDQVFDNNYDFDNLQADLPELLTQHLPEHTGSNAISPTTNHTAITGQLHLSINNYQLDQAYATSATLLDAVLMESYGEYSLWNFRHNDQNHMKLVNGLPSIDTGLELFTQEPTDIPTTRIMPDLLPTQLSITGNFSQPSLIREQDKAPESTDESLNTHSSQSKPIVDSLDTKPSDEDWAALDEFEDSPPNVPVVTPQIETLELDEDVQDAPWER